MSNRDQEKYIDPETLRKLLLGNKEDDEFMMGDIGTISLTPNSHIFFYADIVPSSVLKLTNVLVQQARDNLAESAARDREVEPLHLHISSPGGLASSGFVGYDTIIELQKRIPIFSYIEGHVASAATLLSIAATKRFITPNSDMLIHEISSWVGGKISQISEEYRNLRKMQDKLEEIYLKHSKLEKEALQEILKRDTLLTSEEALEYGLVDEIKTSIF